MNLLSSHNKSITFYKWKNVFSCVHKSYTKPQNLNSNTGATGKIYASLGYNK